MTDCKNGQVILILSALIIIDQFIDVECDCDKKTAYCSSANKVPVALCIRNKDAIKGECDVNSPLQDVYEITDSVNCQPDLCPSKFKPYCASGGLCKNGGQCKEFAGFYFCACTSGYHGQDCSLKIEENRKYVKGIYFLFNPTVLGIRTNVFIFIEETGDDLTIKFSTSSSGEVITLKSNQLKSTPDSRQVCFSRVQGSTGTTMPMGFCDYLPEDKSHYAILFYDIPYREDGPGIIMDYNPKFNSGKGKEFPGFKTNELNITVKNGDSEEFFHSFKQISVYSKKKKCPTQVSLQNCGLSSDQPLQVPRKAKTILRSIVKPNPDCLNPERKFAWDIYNYEKNVFARIPDPIPSDSGDNDKFTIDKFSLKVGLYKIKLTAKSEGISSILIAKGNPSGRYQTIYFDVCFLEILKVPLSPVIEGGERRTVGKSERITLDASKSNDPNQPPNKQTNLRWSWKCNVPGVESCESGVLTSGIWEVPGRITEEISKVQEVKFVLILSTTSDLYPPVTASQTITVSQRPQAQLEISCLKNCGIHSYKTNPKEIVYLKVQVKNQFNVTEFKWSYYTGDTTDMSADSISQPGVSSDLLIIKANTLEQGLSYTFIVKAVTCYSEGTVNECEGSSRVKIVVNEPPTKGTCAISPEDGYKALTKFDISCSDFSANDHISQLRYEFYQISTVQLDMATLLGYSVKGTLKQAILSKENVMVRVSDRYGMFTDFNITVKLKDWEPKPEDIEQMVDDINTLMASGDRSGAVRLAGAIIDIMGNMTNKLTILNNVLDNLNKKKVTDFSDVKLYTSTLKKVATKGVAELEHGIDSKSVQLVGYLMVSLSEPLFRQMKSDNQQESEILKDDINDIALAMLDCADTILASKDESMFNPTNDALALFSIHDQYKKGTTSMIGGLAYIGMAIIESMLPQEEEIVVATNNTVMWMKIDTPVNIANISGIPLNSTTNINMSKDLGEELQMNTKNIGVEVITLKTDPYWWDVEERSIESEIVSIRLWKNPESKMKLVNGISEPLDVYLRVKNTKSQTLAGSVTKPDESDSEDQKDDAVAVHTLEGPHENSNGILFVEFNNLQDSEFLVLLTVDLRPDYELMMYMAQKVTSKSSSLNLKYENITEGTLHFIGILPGQNVPPRQTVNYTMTIYSVHCKVRQKSLWTSPSCVIGEGTSKDTVHCRCAHMSFFGSSIFVAPNTVHPINDLSLLLTLDDNPYVFVFIISLLIFYLILLLWTLTRDRKNRLKRKVIILEDNFPGEMFPYLIVMYTAFNIGAGTSSNVGIVLIASRRSSRPHILRSRERRVLRRNSDDWFIIFTRRHLGTIGSIHLWHDNSGSNPDWCCKRVKVYDLTINQEYTFHVNQWLSVWPGEYPEAVIKAAQPEDVYDCRNVLAQNMLYNLQEKHMWLSIFISHPRAVITKSQRLATVYCIIMLSFLTSIMFYKADKGDNRADEAEYSIKFREIIIAVQSTIISAVLTAVIAICFKRSQVIIPSQPSVRAKNAKRSQYFTGVTGDTRDDNKKKKSKLKGPKKLLRKLLLSLAEGKPLVPILVGKESSESVIRRKRWARAGWILSQVVIWGSAYFIILYGLNMGKVLSKIWVTSASFGFAYGIFVNMPLKILIFSSILSMFGEMCDVITFECEVERAMQKERFGDEQVLTDIVSLRTLPMYYPMSDTRREELQEAALHRNDIMQNIEFFATVLFFLTLLITIGDLWRIRNYNVNTHIQLTLTKSWRPSFASLHDIINATRLTDYLIGTLIPALYKDNWYNGDKLTAEDESLEGKGWVSDTVHRIIGVPQLRQIRVESETCLFALRFNKSKAKCFPALNGKTEDTFDYGLRWGPASKYINKYLLVAWTYHTEESGSAIVDGKSGIEYHNGGYIRSLDNTQEKCYDIISDLIDNGWWDISMRAFFAEFSLYNPNTDSYTMVTVILEHLASGAFTQRMEIRTVHFAFNFVYMFLFVIMLLSFNFRLMLKINRIGIIYCLTTFWSLYDVILIVLGDIAVIVECFKVLRAVTEVSIFKQSRNSEFFHFSNILRYQKVSVMLWCAVLCLAPLRFVKFNLFANMCKTAYYTLYLCKHLLYVISFVVCIVIACHILIINYAICPQNQPLNLVTKFYNTDASAHYSCYMFVSIMIATTYSIAIMIINIVIIDTYKIIRQY